MTLRKKVFVPAVVAFLLLLIMLIVATPFLVDVDRHRPRIAAYIEEQTGKPAQIGRLTLTIFPTLSVRVDGFVLGNPEGFPDGDFFRAVASTPSSVLSRCFAAASESMRWRSAPRSSRCFPTRAGNGILRIRKRPPNPPRNLHRPRNLRTNPLGLRLRSA